MAGFIIGIASDTVNFFYELMGTFGWAVFLCVSLAFLITIPFEVLKKKQMAKQQSVAPEIAEIRKKYGGSAMGVSRDVSMIEDEEIQKLSVDERDERMKNEVSAVYKRVKYRPILLWVPLLLNIIFILYLYAGISAATPDGFYSLTLPKIINNLSDNLLPLFCLTAPALMSVLSSVFNYFKNKANNEKRSSVVAVLVSGLLSFSLMIWVACSASVAIAIAIATFQVFELLGGCFDR
ncbi:MAG: YidC/Oxa1 family membrane protein insertase [Bacteroidaceae bacterium]|nr:YidC/Oxa1 family membrane protein insertase [Bacteroidaceae bacterium]